jgi:hypothetical protein
VSLRFKEIQLDSKDPDSKFWMACYKGVRIERYINGQYFTIDRRFASQQACKDRINLFLRKGQPL